MYCMLSIMLYSYHWTLSPPIVMTPISLYGTVQCLFMSPKLEVLVLFLLPPFFPTHKKLGSLGLFKQAKSAVKYLYGGVVCRSDSQTLSYYKNMKLLLFFQLSTTITHNFLSFSVECNGTSSLNNIFVYVNGLLFGREVSVTFFPTYWIISQVNLHQERVHMSKIRNSDLCNRLWTILVGIRR